MKKYIRLSITKLTILLSLAYSVNSVYSRFVQTCSILINVHVQSHVFISRVTLVAKN